MGVSSHWVRRAAWVVAVATTGIAVAASSAGAVDPNAVGVTVAGGNGQGTAPNQFTSPTGLALDAVGNLYVSDLQNHRVQMWAPGATEGVTVAGGNGGGSDANQLYYAYQLAFDASGNLFVSDGSNFRVQMWAPGATEGVTVAGGNGYGSDANQLSGPSGLALDDDGNLYVVDPGNFRVQKWAPGATEGVTVAGGNGNGSDANQLSPSDDVVVDSVGNIYVSDVANNRVQMWAPGATEGVTVAGGNGWGPAPNQLASPVGLARDADGNLYVADVGNSRVQMWAPGATEGVTVAGGNGFGSAPNQFAYAWDVVLDADGNLYVADTDNERVQKWSQGSVPDPDADADGVDDVIGTGGGAFVDGSTSPPTSGRIVSPVPSGLTARVTDALSPDGVRVTVTGSAMPTDRVTLLVCGFTVKLTAGSDVVLTCGSVIARVVAGVAVVDLGSGASVTIPEGAVVEVGQASGGGYSIEVIEQADSDVMVTVDGVTGIVQPGTPSPVQLWHFSGFSAPVDNAPTMNVVKGGQAVPLKWRLTDVHGNPVTTLASAQLRFAAVSCVQGAPIDTIEQTVTGSSGLQSLGNGYYQMNWKTPKTTGCGELRLDIGQGVLRTALFKLR